MPKRLLILIIPTAAAFLALVGFIAVDFVRTKTGAVPGEAMDFATYVATAGGRDTPLAADAQKVDAIGVTPKSKAKATDTTVTANAGDLEDTQAAAVEVTKAATSSSWFGFGGRSGGREENVKFSCSTDEIGVKRCVSDARK